MAPAKRHNVKSAVADAHERAKDFLDPTEVERLQKAARDNRHGDRDHALVLLIYRHGLRVSEAITMRRDAVNLKQARLAVKRSKNSLSTEQPLAGDELVALKRYLITREDKLPWLWLSEPEGNLSSAIHLRNEASKGRSGRIIPLNRELRAALRELFQTRGRSPYVITSERSQKTSAAVIVNLFAGWYRALGFRGCSSHSGRRTFITTAARKISMVGGSLRDVQMLAGHAALTTTQRYIECDVEAQRKVVDLI